MALRAGPLLAKAQAFGKAINTIADDAALGVALQSMPLQDPPLAALLFHAAIGPGRQSDAAGDHHHQALRQCHRSQRGAHRASRPVVDAILAHAQNQMHIGCSRSGAFADIDLICRGLDRFHRLVRSLTGYIEFARGSRWATVLSAVTKQVSDRIEPRLREVVPDINQALRRGREGAPTGSTTIGILAAINGVYLLGHHPRMPRLAGAQRHVRTGLEPDRARRWNCICSAIST